MRNSRSNNKNRIMLVEDHPVFRYGLIQLINSQNDMIVSSETEESSTAMKMLIEDIPDLVIVDLSLKEDSGLELIKDIRKKYKKLYILVLSMYNESLYAERVLRIGARGYIMKQETYESIIQAIRTVLSGKIYTSMRVSESLIGRVVGNTTKEEESITHRLSDRELQVFQLIGNGYSTKKISRIMNLNINTINTYRERIKIKLSLNDSTELTQQAINWTMQLGN